MIDTSTAVSEPAIAVDEQATTGEVLAARRRARLSDIHYILLGLALFLIPLLVVSPIRQFPLIDDWVYAVSVRDLVHHGRLHIPSWVAATVVAQVFWGALFAEIFGLSFTVLRASTLALTFAGGIALYGIGCELGLARVRALFGTLLFWFNPITFPLSYTFMSDAPATALILISTYFYVRGVRTARFRELIIGSCFAAGAFLVRHPGILVPPAVIAYGLLVRWPLADFVKRAIAIAAMPVVVMATYFAWLETQGVPSEQSRVIKTVFLQGSHIGGHAAIFLGYIILYMGLFCAPIAFAHVRGLTGTLLHSSRLRVGAGLLIWALLVAGLAYGLVMWADLGPGRTHWMPFLDKGAMMHSEGIGPNNLMGQRSVVMSVGVRQALTVLSAVGLFVSGLLLLRWLLGYRPHNLRRTGPTGVVVLVALFQVVGVFPVSAHVLVTTWISFDRYILPLIPLSIVLVLRAGRSIRFQPVLAVVAVALVALYSMAGTHDWLSYNQARWDLGHDLVADGVTFAEIDGGMEWVGWYLYDESTEGAVQPRTQRGPYWTKDIAPTVDSTYIIAFSVLPQYQPVRVREYTTWLSRKPTQLYALKRLPAATQHADRVSER